MGGKYVMSLDEVEQDRYDAFTKEHYSKHKFHGGVPVTLTPTGLGTNVEVKCPKCGEEKKTGIFEDFIFAQPEFFVENKTVEPRIKIDPAILGMTKDQRMFMIVYWDVEHDVEHVLTQIDAFKKFKLK